MVAGDQLLTYDLGPTHPLRPERLKVTWALLESYGLKSRFETLQPRIATLDELLLFHSKDYVERVREYSRLGYGLLDYGDTPAFKGCYEATSWIVGSSIRAVETVMEGHALHASNLSGGLHHAYPERAAGFCIFNDPAICICFLKVKYGCSRIAYIDIDAHHGDGVMYSFYSDPSVLNIDFHESGRYLYPGSGFTYETGCGEAEGLKINVPLPPRTNDQLYIQAYERVVPPAIEYYRPQIILLQSGADSHKGDPLTHLSITARTYSHIAASIHNLAHEFCDGRIVTFGGGGYSLGNVARCWTTVLSVLAEAPIQDSTPIVWRKYYKALTGDDAPEMVNEPQVEVADEAKVEVGEVLKILGEKTCIGKGACQVG
ncbi:MAG: acetoin utilization protein AcuC [Candidatus Bathyarchaeia archaeon]